MKYCIFILIIILLTIVIYNLYNTKIIEEYHEGSNQTTLQSDINNTLNNMNDAFNDYRDYTYSIDTDANKYGSRLSDIDDLYRGSGGIKQRIDNYDPNTILNTYEEHLGKSCSFEMNQDCGGSSGGSNTLPKKFNLETGRITRQECARRCSERDDCISFSYKEIDGEIIQQECILSSVCTENNATDNPNDNLYTKKIDDDYIQFPLLKYNPNYNKICKNDVYQNIETNINDGIMLLGSCVAECESSNECIAFEYNPATQLCSPKSECNEDGCLEEDTINRDDNCNNTTLYSIKESYIGGKNSPSYYSCNDCDNNKTIYNEAFLRFYTGDTGTASLIYTNHVANIGEGVSEMNYYKITQGYQVQVFANYNFSGEDEDYDETGNDKYTWLRSNGRQPITDIDAPFRNFKSFKIYSNNEADTRKICKGSFGICQTIDSGAYNSNNHLNYGDTLPDMEQIFNNTGTAAVCPYENRVCECDGFWGSCTVTGSGNIFTQEWETSVDVEAGSIYDCNIQPRECQCNYNYGECIDDTDTSTYQKTQMLDGSSSDATCPDTNGTLDCDCNTGNMNNYGSCDANSNSERTWIGDSGCPDTIKESTQASGCVRKNITWGQKVSFQEVNRSSYYLGVSAGENTGDRSRLRPSNNKMLFYIRSTKVNPNKSNFVGFNNTPIKGGALGYGDPDSRNRFLLCRDEMLHSNHIVRYKTYRFMYSEPYKYTVLHNSIPGAKFENAISNKKPSDTGTGWVDRIGRNDGKVFLMFFVKWVERDDGGWDASGGNIKSGDIVSIHNNYYGSGLVIESGQNHYDFDSIASLATKFRITYEGEADDD